MFRFRSGVAVVVGMTLLLLLCACSTQKISDGGDASAPSKSKTPIQIAFITNNASDYWLIAEAGVNDATKELNANSANGYSVQFIMPSNGAIAVQQKMVDGLVANGCKAIAISLIDPDKQTPWLDSVATRCAVITQDSDAPHSSRLAYVGTDNHSAGLLAGKMILRDLPKGGKIILFVGDREAQNAHDREQGIRDALTGSNVKIVAVWTDDTDHVKAKSNAADALVSYPDLQMEVGLWSYNGPAILAAVEDAHKVGKVKIVCFDQEKKTLAGVKSGAIYATIVQQPYEFGFKGTKLLASIATGDRTLLPKTGALYFPAKAVTSIEVNKYIAELDKETGKSWDPGL